MRGRAKVAVLAAGAFLLSLILAGAVSAVPAGTASQAATTAGSSTYNDSTGEAGAAPDIGSVVVSNDNAGKMSFAVTFVNRSGLNPTDFVAVDIDSDRNPVTGSTTFGFDYAAVYYRGSSALLRWDLTTQRLVLAPMNTLTTGWSGSTLTFSVSSSELGSTTGFRFGVFADANPDDPAAPVDFAPDPGRELWTYDVKLAPTLAITGLDCTPEPAVAGRKLTGRATVAVTRSGVPEVLPSTAKVTWRATFGKVRLTPLATKSASGVLTSTWKLPATVKAKVVRVTVTVTTEGVTISKTHLHRVR